MEKQTETYFDAAGKEAMQWYGWASPIGLGLGLGLMLVSLGMFLWLLHLANIIH
ncbi:MAG TPA: hypothetical protein VF040_17710 [Ktedonobacterales bacterium]